MCWGNRWISFFWFPFLFARSYFFCIHGLGSKVCVRDFVIAVLGLFQWFILMNWQVLRIRALSVLTGPYTVFSNYLGDGFHHPFQDACHPLWASVTFCCSVRRRPSVSFCDFPLFLWPYTIGFTMLLCFVFTTLWLDFSCFDVQSLFNYGFCVVRFLWFSNIAVVYEPVLNKKEWSCHAARRGGQSADPHKAPHASLIPLCEWNTWLSSWLLP